ncbi:MAG: FAD-binding oxidoreductase [Streptosporangiaceae bacterium]
MDLAHQIEPMVNPGVLVEALSRGLPAERLVLDPDVLAAISHDDAEWAPTGQASVGVRARSEAEVQHVVRVCAELGAPVVPRGGGTGLSGGANAVRGCVILDVSAMNQVLEIDQDNLLAVVQPGVINGPDRHAGGVGCRRGGGHRRHHDRRRGHLGGTVDR